MSLKHYKPKTAGGAPGGPCTTAPDGELQATCPALEEFLRETELSPGKGRKTGTILLFTEGGSWKACLADRELGLVAFVAGASFRDVLGSAEGLLEGSDGDWRPTRQPPRR